MELPINPEPQNLNKSVFSGKKWWQWMCIGIAFVIAVIFTVVLGDRISNSVNGIVCAALVTPLGYVGVFKKNGMDFFEYFKEKKKNMQGGNTFNYVSDNIYKD